MLRLKNTGEGYIEYIIIFALVIAFTFMALNYVGESIKDKIVNDYFQGEKIKLSIKGIYTEKIGPYGGTKSSPFAITKNNNTITYDLGYITLNELPNNAPQMTSEENKYGTKTIRYYAELLEKTYDSVMKNPVHKEQAPYLKTLAEIAYGLAGLIDEIAYYDNERLNYAVVNETVLFEKINIEKFDTFTYLIREYELYPENILVNLELKASDFDLYSSTGMLYSTVIRYDTGEPLFIWLIRADANRDGSVSLYTLSKRSHGYTSLDKAIDIKFDLLRFNQSEENIDEADFRFYNLLKMFELYSKLYDSLSTDEATKHLVKLINEDVKTIVMGIEKDTNRPDNKLKIDFSPATVVDPDILKRFSESINNIKYKKEGE
ncbi:MAG: hypothetical protein AB1782_15435 [Cyanobacteriota bacterium]